MSSSSISSCNRGAEGRNRQPVSGRSVSPQSGTHLKLLLAEENVDELVRHFVHLKLMPLEFYHPYQYSKTSKIAILEL